MKNNSKLGEARKTKDGQQAIAVLESSVKETHRVAEANQLRLRQLELAIANLTTICCAIRHEMYSLDSSPTNQGSFSKAEAEVIEMKRPSSTRSNSPDLKEDVLKVQMHQLVKQAAALGIVKDSKSSSIKLSGTTNADSKPPARPIQKNVQASINQKSSTKPLVRSVEPVMEKKVTAKPETVKKCIVTTQAKTKCSLENGAGHSRINAAAAAAKVSQNTTVKKTKTTIPKVYDNQSAAIKSKGTTTVKNVETTQEKGYLKKTVKDHQGLIVATKCHSPTKTNTSASDAELKQPRKKWSTAKEITFMK